MQDIQELKLILTFVINLTETMEKSLEDGKFGYNDLIRFLICVKAASPALEHLKDISPEIRDLDEFEVSELVQYAKDILNLQHQKVEQIVEIALDIGNGIFKLKAALKDK